MVTAMSDVEMPVIDREGGDLVYEVIADHLVKRIDSGEFPPGSRLPGEVRLADDYGVARMTISRTIRELRDRRRVRTVRGKGTYVVKLDDAAAGTPAS